MFSSCSQSIILLRFILLPCHVLVMGLWLPLLSCNKAESLKGVDKQALFAPPTQAELEQVKADWKNRDLASKDFRLEQAIELSDNGLLLQVVSFRVNGYKQYGALIIPSTAKPLPLYLFINGYSNEDPINAHTLQINTSTTASIPFVYAIPALRGQTLLLTINGKQYRTPPSEGPHEDAFDGATDDAIAFLNVIQAHFSAVDANRVAVRGGSRGGTVALLMAAREQRVKLAIGVAFPSDLVALTEQHQGDATYQKQFLQALLTGSATLAESRLKMIASSPLFFCESLPNTQLHFGTQDHITPAEQGQVLKARMEQLGLEDRVALYTYPGRNHANIAENNQELTTRIQAFLSQLF